MVVQEFAEKYPVERLSFEQAYALQAAGSLIFDRTWQRDHKKPEVPEGINGRMPTHF